MSNWLEYIFFHARTRPVTPAVILEDRVVTYAMLREGITSCAQRLAAMNLDRDGVVAVVVENPLRHLVLCLALYRLGIVSLSLDPKLSGGQQIKVAAALGDHGARAFLDPANRFIEVADSWFAEPASKPDNLPEVAWEETQIYRHSLTSGSTGVPKIIMHTGESIGKQMRLDGAHVWDRALCLPGLSTMYGFSAAFAILAVGKALCFAPNLHQAARMIELFSIDRVIASTEQLLGLTRIARKLRMRLKCLRNVRISGSVASRALLETAMIHVCRDINCHYGTTEAGAIAEAPAQEVVANPGLAGYVQPEVEVAIFDAEDRRCPAGTIGQVRSRKTADGKAGHPWLDSGDVGRFDSEDRLFIFGRTYDAAGLPTDYSPGLLLAHEIEHRVRLEWDLTDAASLMVESAAAGASEIWFAVVQGNGITAEKVNALALANGINLPIRLFDLPVIPRGASGKIDRPRLKAAMLTSTVTPKAPWS